MRKPFAFTGPAALLPLFMFLISCGSEPAPKTVTPQGPQSYGSNLAASQGESEIILNSMPNSGTLNVYVDGVLQQRMTPQDSVKLIVSDGQHMLLVDWAGKNRSGDNVSVKGEPLTLNVKSQRHVYSIALPELLGGSSMLMMDLKVKLTPVAASILSGRQASRDSAGIGGAAIRAGEILISDLPKGSVIAVLSPEPAVEELEAQLIKHFKIVERKKLNESIRAEQILGMSGEVNEKTAARIGHLSGASVIITGTISGSGTERRLSIRALDVETGELLSMPKIPF